MFFRLYVHQGERGEGGYPQSGLQLEEGGGEVEGYPSWACSHGEGVPRDGRGGIGTPVRPAAGEGTEGEG